MTLTQMKLRSIIEVLPLDPNDHQIIVPVHEHLVKLSKLNNGRNIGLWEALFFYAYKNVNPLTDLLEQDSKARDLLVKFEEHWFVRAESAEGYKTQSSVTSAAQAVMIARSASSKNVCGDVLKLMGYDVQCRKT